MIDPLNPDFTNTPISPKRVRFSYDPVDKQAKPSVSIITPYYNTGSVFLETVEAVMTQSFQQWEWLIINDCSTDPDSISLLEKLAQKDTRVRIINHEINKGLSASRNTGIQEAMTPYVVVLDSDDLLEVTAIEKWFWFLESHPEYAFVNGYSLAFGGQNYLWPKGYGDQSDFLLENTVTHHSMIRKAVYLAGVDFDENNRKGLEDWEFWLKAASNSFWGYTIPEFLIWYRRRTTHTDRWVNLSDENLEVFRDELREKYPKLWSEGFPKIQPPQRDIYEPLPINIPCQNLLQKTKPRLLMLIPWCEVGGADKFNLDAVEQLVNRGWEVSIITTLAGSQNPWLPKFTKFTPDVFILPYYLNQEDFPRFISYFISSRQPDALLLSNSELGYRLLPFLRGNFPDLPILDYCHMEEEYWHNGGYAQQSAESEELLDLHVVSSEHLKGWMTNRGANEDRIRVCYTNIDTDQWRPLPAKKLALREELKIERDTPVLLYAARITLQKQPKVFAETMLRLAQKGVKFKALVAGDGPDLTWLKQFVTENKLKEQVSLLGAVENARIKELLNASDIFFLPSLMEGISLAIFEAMALGVVPVGADVGGQKELVTEDCGFLLPRADEESEVTAYTKVLLDLIKQPSKIKKMGEAARERVSTRFRLVDMGNQLEELIKEAAYLHKTCELPPVSEKFAITSATRAVQIVKLEESRGFFYNRTHAITKELQMKIDTLFEEKLFEIWVRDVQLASIKSSKLYRLNEAIFQDRISFKKLVRLIYVLGSVMTPAFLQKRLAPVIYHLRKRISKKY